MRKRIRIIAGGKSVTIENKPQIQWWELKLATMAVLAALVNFFFILPIASNFDIIVAGWCVVALGAVWNFQRSIKRSEKKQDKGK